MKYFLLFLLFGTALVSLQAQDSLPDDDPVDKGPWIVVSSGLLQGGSVFGVDVELRILQTIGFQAGGGALGYSGSFLFHFHDLTSSAVALNYWHQGIGNLHVQSLFGPTFLYRGESRWTFQAGVGFLVEEGPVTLDRNWNLWQTQPMISVGYIVWSR